MLTFKFFSLITKIFYLTVRLFNLGSGTTLISNIYLAYVKNNPNLNSFIFTKGIIFVTGTNGKTTTSKLIADTLTILNYKVLHNETGGNIFRSIVGFFLLNANFILKNKYDFLVLEIDEGSVELFSKYFIPTHLIVLNFSRDQLDRYFEIENITSSLVKTLQKNKRIVLIYNSEDSYCNEIADNLSNLKYSFEKDFELLSKTQYTESFMATNISALKTLTNTLGHDISKNHSLLKSLQKPYGRGERIFKHDKAFEIHLAKNPDSFNNNLIELVKRKNLKNFLIILNDNQPDGTDISWIYDIDPVLLNSLLYKKRLFFSGKRAYEMATRCRYATPELNVNYIDKNLKETFLHIIENDYSEIIVICNYSGMLEVRKILTGKNIL